MSAYNREYKPSKRQSVVLSSGKNSFRDSLRATHAAHPLLELQRRYGNRGVRRMVTAISRQGEGKGEVLPDIERAINAGRGGGQPLDSGVRERMEPAFRADFSGVRVHTDAEADSLNRSLSARAFTTGRDVFFRSGAYNPGSSNGRELIAHELTHVVQQAGGISPKLTMGQPNDEYEQEADRVARAVVQQEHFQRQPMEEEEEEMQMKGEGQGIQRREEEEGEEDVLQPEAGKGPGGSETGFDVLSQGEEVPEGQYVDGLNNKTPSPRIQRANGGRARPTELIQILTGWTPGANRYGFQLKFRCRSTSGRVRDLQNQAPNLIWRERVTYSRNDFAHRINPPNPTILPAGGVSFAAANTTRRGTNLLEFDNVTDTHWMPTWAVRATDFRPIGARALPAVMESRQVYQYSPDGGANWRYLAGAFIIRRTLYRAGKSLRFRTNKVRIHSVTEGYKP